MTDRPPPLPPGWYSDPEQVETQRYWDGQNWTDQRAPARASTPFGLSRKVLERIVVGLVVLAASVYALVQF